MKLLSLVLIALVTAGCASGVATSPKCSPSNGTALIVSLQPWTSAVVRAKLVTLRPPPPSNNEPQTEISHSPDAAGDKSATADVRVGGSAVLSLTPGLWSIEIQAPGFRPVSTSVEMRADSFCRMTISLTER